MREFLELFGWIWDKPILFLICSSLPRTFIVSIIHTIRFSDFLGKYVESIPCPLTSENEAILCSKCGSTQTPFTALVTVALWGRVASTTNRHCYTEYKFQLLEKFTNFEFLVDFLIIIAQYTWYTIITSALTLPQRELS